MIPNRSRPATPLAVDATSVRSFRARASSICSVSRASRAKSGGHEGGGKFATRHAGDLKQLPFIFSEAIELVRYHVDEIARNDILGNGSLEPRCQAPST